MPVFNGQEYLQEAIDSVLDQSFSDFEFIIIDDGSSDATIDILADYEKQDSRIVIRRFEQNQGISTSLNYGMYQARGQFIARMDADDISRVDRLEKQVEFLNMHSEIDVCGTWVELTGNSAGEIWRYPLSHDAICAGMIFANTLVHSTVMFRADSIKKYKISYDENTQYAQDYELWSRILPFVKFANLGIPLLKYRVYMQDDHGLKLEKQLETKSQVLHRLLSSLAVKFSQEEFDLHQQLGLHQYKDDEEFFLDSRIWLEKLLKANMERKLVLPPIFSKELGRYWTEVCIHSNASALVLVVNIMSSILPFYGSNGILKTLQFPRFMLRKIYNSIG